MILLKTRIVSAVTCLTLKREPRYMRVTGYEQTIGIRDASSFVAGISCKVEALRAPAQSALRFRGCPLFREKQLEAN
jgi:hypothetical protein